VSTISVRVHESQFVVAGSTTFRGGFPIPHPDEPDGIFGEWHWNGHRLEARVDRLGMFPLYYSEIPNGIAISTRLDALIEAGASSEIDWAALQILFRMGFHVGRDTVFRAIKAFPVGGCLSWSPGKLEIKERLPIVRPNTLSRSAAKDAYIELFRAAIRKRIVEGAPIHLPLSGGRDSRHILYELVAAGATPECYTSPYATMQNDVVIAREVCAAVGVRHAEVAQPTALVTMELEKNIHTSFQATDHGWLWPLVQSIANSKAVAYDGIAGDVLSAGHFHDDENSALYRAGCLEDLAQRLAPKEGLALVPSRWRDAISASDPHPSLIRELLRYQNTPNPMMFFHLYNRSRRAVSVIIQGMLGRVMRAVFAPFLDRDVFDLLAGLPESMFADKMFHTEAIAQAFPGTAGIGYAKKTPIPGSLCRLYSRQGLRFVVGAASSPLLDRKAAMLRFTRSLIDPRHAKEAIWILQQSVMLHQLGRLMGTPFTD